MNSKKMKILFASFEAIPFSKTGGLGDVAGSLPAYIKSKDCDIRVILPKISSIPDQYKAQMKHLCEYNVPLGWRNEYCGLEYLEKDGVTFYFIDNEYYFKRSNVYGEFDDGERVAFFSKALLESIQHIDNFIPDLIHCNDWHTALVPVFLHEQYRDVPGFNNIKTIFTVHNLKFQGQFSDSVIGDICGLLGTPAENQLKIGNAANYMKGALLYSDMITTVSPSYAEEICTPFFGENLDDIFKSRKDHLRGIINGIDTKNLNPNTDKLIPNNYSASKMGGKAKCKEALQKELGLSVDKDIPIFAVVSRLTEQKGMDLITYNLPMFAEGGIQLVVLGTGDAQFSSAFKYYADRFPESIAVKTEFNEPLSRRIYAGCDAFLMPSKFEPCGLSQMMAMRYGSIPIVRETGGLKDTVQPYNKYTHEGTGFSFANYNAHELKYAIETAVKLFKEEPNEWADLVHRAMKKDFSWSVSAKEYKELYRTVINK